MGPAYDASNSARRAPSPPPVRYRDPRLALTRLAAECASANLPGTALPDLCFAAAYRPSGLDTPAGIVPHRRRSRKHAWPSAVRMLSRRPALLN